MLFLRRLFPYDVVDITFSLTLCSGARIASARMAWPQCRTCSFGSRQRVGRLQGPTHFGVGDLHVRIVGGVAEGFAFWEGGMLVPLKAECRDG